MRIYCFRGLISICGRIGWAFFIEGRSCRPIVVGFILRFSFRVRIVSGLVVGFLAAVALLCLGIRMITISYSILSFTLYHYAYPSTNLDPICYFPGNSLVGFGYLIYVLIFDVIILFLYYLSLYDDLSSYDDLYSYDD